MVDNYDDRQHFLPPALSLSMASSFEEFNQSSYFTCTSSIPINLAALSHFVLHANTLCCTYLKPVRMQFLLTYITYFLLPLEPSVTGLCRFGG